jgi:hypothetical protein
LGENIIANIYSRKNNYTTMAIKITAQIGTDLGITSEAYLRITNYQIQKGGFANFQTQLFLNEEAATSTSALYPYPSAGGIIGVEQYLSKHEENATLREKIKGLELELQYLREQNQREIDRLRSDHELALKAAKDSNQMFSQGLGMLMNRMGVGE